jgi:hypothetical protein
MRASNANKLFGIKKLNCNRKMNTNAVSNVHEANPWECGLVFLMKTHTQACIH